MSGGYRNVVIPLETTARELNPKICLAIALARKGFHCYVGNKALAQEVACQLGNAIYLDKGYHRGISEGIYAELRAAGCLLMSLDEENGVDYRDFHMLDTRMPDTFLEAMDMVMLWGSSQREHLAENRDCFDPARIAVTGHPRFDLLKPPYHELYADKAERLRSEYGRFVLINTSSKYANNINGRESVLANYESRVPALRQRLAYDDRRLELNIRLARRIATELEMNVVLRPHPEESITPYQEAFADLRNAHAVYEDSALYWIYAAECVIHNNSTTGLEAAMLGRAPLAYTPIPTEENFTPWIPLACSHRAESEQQALAFVAEEGWLTPPPQRDEILRDYFSFDRDALTEVVNTILDCASSHRDPAKIGRLGPMYRANLLLRSARARIRSRAAGKLANNKLRDLTPEVVRNRVKRLQELLPPGPDIRLRMLHRGLYEIGPAS